MTIKIISGDATVEFPDGTDAETIRRVMSGQPSAPTPAPKPAEPQGWGDWAREMVVGKQDPANAGLPTVYEGVKDIRHGSHWSQFAGASDAQLGDRYQQLLGDRFVRRERDANGYEIVVMRGPDGQEHRAYVNKPGLDAEDVARGIRGAIPYLASGGLAGVAAKGGGVLLNSAAQGLAAGGTSIAGDIAQEPLGSKQGIEGEKAALSAGFGAAGPLAAKLIGSGYGMVKNAVSPPPGALRNVSKGAIERVTEAMDAGGLTPAAVAQKSRQLGPEGMLADMGGTVQTDAAMLARSPLTRDIVVPPLEARQAAAPGRIRSDLSANLGPPVDMNRLMLDLRRTYGEAAAPLYAQFYQTRIPLDMRLAPLWKRAQASGAVREAQRLMRIDGIDPDVLARDNASLWTGREWDYIKRAVDQMASKAAGSNARESLRRFSTLAREIRTTIDELISPGAPEQSAWAQARAIAGEEKGAEEMAKFGQRLFSGRTDPHLVKSELAGASDLEKEVLRYAGRNDLRTTMGRAASNFGPKADSAARRALNSDFSRQTLKMVAPDRKAAGAITRRIDAENTMADTFEAANRNSITSRIEGFRQRYPSADGQQWASEAGKKGPIGLATEAALRIGDKLLGSPLRKQNEKIATDAARLLVAQGANRDEIVMALFAYARRKGLTADQTAAIERVAQSIWRPAVPTAAGAAASE